LLTRIIAGNITYLIFQLGVWLERPEVRRPVGRPRFRREDSIKMDLQGVGLGGLVWIALAEDRDRWRTVVNAVMKLRVP
jgi:hypothetical protein